MPTISVVTPSAPLYEVLLTADTAISHHDPTIRDKSNRVLLNRQKQLLALPAGQAMPDDAQIGAICQLEPVPLSAVDLIRDLSFPEFVACALVRVFLDLYNSPEGTGLFTDVDRYARLEARVHQAAIAAPTLRRWWDRLVDSLQVGIHGSERDPELLTLLTLPAGLQQLVLRSLAEDYRSIVALARLWHSEGKLEWERYAEAVGREIQPKVVLEVWRADGLAGPSSGAHVAEVPAVSANTLRHQLVREPLWLHMQKHLGIEAGWPGRGPLPAGVEALFENGGNIEEGAKQPSNAHGLA